MAETGGLTNATAASVRPANVTVASTASSVSSQLTNTTAG
uniref:Uncharacterized protein n=1 Tax=Romanomermis culicivorax TaxID=13658 RepID=A0A915I9U1_ROMCU